MNESIEREFPGLRQKWFDKMIADADTHPEDLPGASDAKSLLSYDPATGNVYCVQLLSDGTFDLKDAIKVGELEKGLSQEEASAGIMRMLRSESPSTARQM